MIGPTDFLDPMGLKGNLAYEIFIYKFKIKFLMIFLRDTIMI